MIRGAYRAVLAFSIQPYVRLTVVVRAIAALVGSAVLFARVNGTVELFPTADPNVANVNITMPVGTPVHAARGGTVMDVEEDFNRGGTDRSKFVDKANHVRILHADGTMGLYAHLDLASVGVRPGSRVRAGQQIARSGNTGFSSGPHLHFAVQANVGMKLISLPFKFQTASGSPAAPEEAQVLRGLRGEP